MKYKVKTDLWIRLILLSTVFGFIPLAFFTPSNELWILGVSFALMAVIVLPLFNMWYELSDEELIISIYIFKQRIKYENIKSIKMCSNWRSSSALSRERIEIKEHGKNFFRGTTYISPENREEFFSMLERKCTNLENTKKQNIWDE